MEIKVEILKGKLKFLPSESGCDLILTSSLGVITSKNKQKTKLITRRNYWKLLKKNHHYSRVPNNRPIPPSTDY